MNIIIPRNEMFDPNDEMMFHLIYESGYSEYRRGIPANPRKCCGKNVRLTPMNIIENWIFNIFLFIINPVNKGYQNVNPLMMANAAPIDNT